jgi:hypothetical protein
MGAELIASGLAPTAKPISAAQTVGKEFGNATKEFLKYCYTHGFERLRPPGWGFQEEAKLTNYFQYAHLEELRILREGFLKKKNPDEKPEYRNAALLGGDYHVIHDVLMFRDPESIANLNDRAADPDHGASENLVDESDAALCIYTPLLQRNQEKPPKPIIHAAVSTKWTLRSDRAQNVRTEALNLQKHRKGRTPHLVAVTGEPLPSRLESLALGTGEIDCVYHVALTELLAGAEKSAGEPGIHHATRRARKAQLDKLYVLIEGRQLRDIADLPFDLAL